MSYSREERRALCALLDETGPDAPTLCEGWTTGDLAAHLVLRERRPDAAAGVAGGPLAGYGPRAAADQEPDPVPRPGADHQVGPARAVGDGASRHGRAGQRGGVLRAPRGRAALRARLGAS